MPKVILIPCPIDESNDNNAISSEVQDTIATLHQFFVENVRTTRRFISSLKLGISIEELTFHEIGKHADPQIISRTLKNLESDIGVVSEAGVPGIADPGADVVRQAHLLGIDVVPLSGPSSIYMALMSSGFGGQQFVFHGYLPINKKEKESRIRKLEKDAGTGYTQIFMETPFRNNQLMEQMVNVLNPSTQLCICASISGTEQFIRSKSVEDWKREMPDLNKKPAIFLIGQ